MTTNYYDGHFRDFDGTQTYKLHFFEQLFLDLRWATKAVKTFNVEQGYDSLYALHIGFKCIAGRRWSRFKCAEEEENSERSSEMEAFARFWYGISSLIEAEVVRREICTERKKGEPAKSTPPGV